jgi:hypothetical protein
MCKVDMCMYKRQYVYCISLVWNPPIAAESLYCGVILTGDFDRLKINTLVSQFKMKKADQIQGQIKYWRWFLLIYTPSLETEFGAAILAPFGLSDRHNVVVLEA